MSNYLEGLFCYSELKFASVILLFFPFIINHLLNLSCIQCVVLRLRHAEVNTTLSKEHPVQKGDRQGEQGSQCSGLRAVGSQRRVHRRRASASAWGSRGRGLELNLGT